MFIYGSGGRSMRSSHGLRVDKRDLDDEGRPTHLGYPVGAKVSESPAGAEPGWVEFASGDPPASGEKMFDHRLTDPELEKEFPGYGQRAADLARIAAVRSAAAAASGDDELARLVSEGVLQPADVPDLVDVNARLVIRKKEPIK